jgi:hypothetical protein
MDGFEFSPHEEGISVTECLEGFSLIPFEDIHHVAAAMLEFSRPLDEDQMTHLPVGSIALAKLGHRTTAFKKIGWGHWLIPGDNESISTQEILLDGWTLTLIHLATGV